MKYWLGMVVISMCSQNHIKIGLLLHDTHGSLKEYHIWNFCSSSPTMKQPLLGH